ncbi:probable mediator of RNA polymerase II transcription subunit 26c [Malania oleifera]|uniref:probable mediator of RNA polymerase II transcription subunit 26c n=1 Tax=Malania oleifera TaxID=397392 RepID=UPI0025AEAAD6|nr:probable mediator of RNA polymerase II transcription subunit 26c [Malania oleifera]
MDFHEFRSVVRNSGVDVWTLIETAISVAALDYEREFRCRRDRIVEKLYAPIVSRCRYCGLDCDKTSSDGTPNEKHESREEAWAEKENNGCEAKGGSPLSLESGEKHEDGHQQYGSFIDDEQRKILAIKQHLNDPDKSDNTLVDLLLSLADMEITFSALKETDIGRHVNRLRKHSSNEVRRLVKHLVRKWKDLVDEWVRLNAPGESTASVIVAVGDSHQETHPKGTQNGHRQVPEFAYSPNPQNKRNWDPEHKGRTPQSLPVSVSASVSTKKEKEERESLIDSEKFASARKRLHENYQEAENAKRQRTIQVMDVHSIPKPKNAFFAKSRGSVTAKHW